MEALTTNINDKSNKIDQYAKKLLELARDTITVKFRFLDVAIARIKTVSKPGINGFFLYDSIFYYDPVFLLKEYIKEPNIAIRAYFHMILHCVFLHSFEYDKLNKEYWDIAADIAVENIILELELTWAAMLKDSEEIGVLAKLKKSVNRLTAEKIYKEFIINKPSAEMIGLYRRLFSIDNHDMWNKKTDEDYEISEEDWKKITRRIRTELNAFSDNKTGTESLGNNINEAIRDRYNYREILQKFTVLGEEIKINDDEFDYIYYMHGLSTYKNMPLIEPLEYKEVNKVKDFVIAIDTSASCRGDTVKAFVQRTYEILKDSENFFNHINVHIIQCDENIQSDTKIENDSDFQEFIKHGEIKGFGSTDFRPVFDYVDELQMKGEFDSLKGLIYFTDGYGIYPEKMPEYDVIFAFLNEDINRQEVPGWAIKVVMEDELSEY